jgi:hypothetical protein
LAFDRQSVDLSAIALGEETVNGSKGGAIVGSRVIKCSAAQAAGLPADKFRYDSSPWPNRWSAVLELFMVSGNYSVATEPFPARFSTVVDVEIAAAK